MSRASTQALKAFNEALERCGEEYNTDKLQVDIGCVYELVQNNKDAAYYSTELKCILSQHWPNYLKMASMVAWSYNMCFGDDTLITMVRNAAQTAIAQEALNAKEAAAFVEQTLKDLTDLAMKAAKKTQPEPPARKAALKWWQESGKTEAFCDNCNKAMQRDEGYLINGRQWVIPLIDGSEHVVDIGEELICEACGKEILGL